MRKIAAGTAKILAFAITLFFLGPQFGSLDIDRDGVPDVPVVVLHRSNNQRVRPTRSIGQTEIAFAAASLFGPLCNDSVPMKLGIVEEPRDSRVDSIVPLRC
jgi:hypothetical protein